MKRIVTLFLLGAAAQALAQYSSLQVPKVISYQGRVTQNGAPWNPATGEGYFVFALIEPVEQGYNVLWNNYDGDANPTDPAILNANMELGADHMLPLPVSGGQFSVRLGTTGNSGKNREIPSTVFFDANNNSVRGNVKLAVWFSANANTFHRLGEVPDNPATTMVNEHQLNDIDLASVPYALVAGIAETVQDRAITTAKLAPGGSNADQLQVTASQIAPGAVNASILTVNSVTEEKISAGAVSFGKLATASVSLDNLTNEVMQKLVPVGTVVAFAGTTAPAGWLLCHGDPYPRTGMYANLFAVISETHGRGDGTTTFNVPDYRGIFLRGVNSGAPASRDPDRDSRTAMNPGGAVGNAVGSVQADELKSHSHFVNARFGAASGHGIAAGAAYTYNEGTTSGATGGSETRPKNAYVNYIIKY